MVLRLVAAVGVLVAFMSFKADDSYYHHPGADAPCRGVANDPSRAALRVPGQLTIAAYNVEWLFDGVDDPVVSPWQGRQSSSCPGHAQGLNECDEAGVEARLRRLGATLDSLGADVALLSEVESCEMMQRAADAAADQRYSTYLVPGKDSHTGQNVGVLSRLSLQSPPFRSFEHVSYPLPGSQCGYTGKPARATASKHIVTRLVLPELGEVSLVGVHLKARPTDPASCAKREAQAEVVRRVARGELEAGRHVIVLGDMNDFDESGPDASGQLPLSSALARLKDLDEDGQSDLENVAVSWLPEAERYSMEWWHKGTKRGSMIDHVLLSEGLASRVVAVEVARRLDPDHSVSDHWPLVVTLRLPSGEELL